jgi:hypothetical protein
MKKIYLSLFVFFISASVFAGGWFQDFSSPVSGKAESAATDDEWYFTGTAGMFGGITSDWKMRTSFTFSGIERPESSFIYLDGAAGRGGSFSLVSPAFTPASGESLYYKFQEIKVTNYGDSKALEIYVEIATKVDGAWTWAESTTNILASLSGHNTATTAITVSSTALSAYTDQEIRIRFRGITGVGDFIAAFYTVAVFDGTATDLAVSTSQNVISQIPLKHAGQALNASVQNLGKAIAADASTVTASIVGASSSFATADVPALDPLETATLATFSSSFVPQSFGDYQLQYALSTDDNASNNTAVSNTFTITPNTFASDKGTVDGYAGSTSVDLGNKFTLAVKDKVESISVAWAKLNSNPNTSDFQLVIYALGADGSLNTTPVYTSDALARPDNATTPPHSSPRLATFETYPVDLDSLDAGAYIFAVRSTVNIGIGSEYGDQTGVHYSIDRNNGYSLSSTAGQSLLIRVNTASDIILSPAVGSKTAGINEPVVIEGTAITGLAASPAITIKKGEDNVADVSASYVDGKVTIAHAAFDYNSTYTVTVPANTITGYAQELSWSFTTVSPLTAKTFLPANNATSVLLNAPVTVTFDRNIPAGSSLEGITIKALKADGSDSIAVENVSATIDGAVLSIAHDLFARSTKYKATIPAAAISELEADTSWVFTSVPPVAITSTYPANGQYDVGLNQATVWVIFNQAVDTVSLAGITINDTPVTATLGTGTQNNRVIIRTDGLTPFPESTLYTVSVPAGAIVGYAEAITWSFTSLGPIAVVDTLPKAGATDVFLGAEISVEFNKPVTKLGYMPPVATIIAGTDTIQGVDYAVDATNSKKVVVSHTQALTPATEYTVTLPANFVGAWSDTIRWTFTTAPAPEIVSFTPADEAENVSVSNLVEVTFNQTIDTVSTAGITINSAAPRSISIQSTGDGLTRNKLRLVHDPFTQDTEYTVVIPAGSILGYDEAISWSFTTVPALTYTTSPADEATDVALDAPMKIEFNRAPLRPRMPSGSIEISGTGGETVEVTGTSWNVTGDTLSIAHAPFDFSTTYTVTVPSGAIVAADENLSNLSWSFTTTDDTGLRKLSDASGVYPTLTSGDITVVSEPGSLIKVVDLTGVARATYRSTGKYTPVRLEGANGLYLVVVDGVTYKVALQK